MNRLFRYFSYTWRTCKRLRISISRPHLEGIVRHDGKSGGQFGLQQGATVTFGGSNLQEFQSSRRGRTDNVAYLKARHFPVCGSGNEIRHFASLHLGGTFLVIEIRDLYDVEGTSVHYKHTFRILQTGLPYTTNAPSIHYKWGLRRVWKMGAVRRDAYSGGSRWCPGCGSGSGWYSRCA